MHSTSFSCPRRFFPQAETLQASVKGKVQERATRP